MRHHPALPTLTLTIGLFSTILYCLFIPFFPSDLWVALATIGTIITFFLGRFLLCGIGLGLIAVGLNALTPYSESFSNCHFSAQIIQPNYSQRHLGQEVRLFASDIICNNNHLPAQAIQYWDNSKKISSHVGKRLTVSAHLLPVHSRLNPYSFDYERYLLSEGVRLSAKKLRIIDSHHKGSLLLQAKSYIADRIFNHLSPDNAGVILALLTGNRSALSPEQKAIMQATGTSHLLAISGLHLALVGGLAWLLFQWAWALSWRLSDRISPRHAGAIAALIVITIYAVFTGFDIPVKRAWVMFSLMILSWLLGRGLSSNSLLLAAGIVLFISPYAAISVGFYFSFIATFIVLWCTRLSYSPLINVLIMQLLINLMLFPITWLTFGIISPVAFFANLLVIPWLGLWVLPWAVLASLCSFISEALAKPIWAFLDSTTSMLWQTIAFAEQLDWTLTPHFRPSLTAVTLALSMMFIGLLLHRKWLFMSILLIFIPFPPTVKPTLIVADRGYTSALIHNGHDAIIINPGRRYRHINHATMWLRYLQQNQLNLRAIILENDKLTRISSTQWLLDYFPKTTVITLTKLDLPYPSHYCQSLEFEYIVLTAQKEKSHCKIALKWFEQSIVLFSDGFNAIHDRAMLTWKGEMYSADALGAIIISHHDHTVDIKYLRHSKRLWRNSK